MQTEVIISGFGGQGVLFVGQLMAYAAVEQGKHVTWIPSYGPEMRGGTAHCVVIVSDEEIGSPIVRNPTAAVVMNLPSLERYEPLVKPGGVLVVNTSLVDRSPQRTDVEAVMVPAIEVAEALGDQRLANLVMLGALLERLPVLTFESIEKALRGHIAEHRRHLVDANLRALAEGRARARERVSLERTR